jgi:hypothetical protein
MEIQARSVLVMEAHQATSHYYQPPRQRASGWTREIELPSDPFRTYLCGSTESAMARDRDGALWLALPSVLSPSRAPRGHPKQPHRGRL